MIYLLLPIFWLLGCEDKAPCGEDCNNIPPYVFTPESSANNVWVRVLNIDPIRNENGEFTRGLHCVVSTRYLKHLHDVVYVVHDVPIPAGTQCPNRAVVEFVE